ncbi:AAA family ATPase [Pseudomonas sp. NPDC089534]|uniref:AAA family ATPase n=1 Tax=Pseudomonas sp. NPDC089534 TaxID=3364468 RepID=UPI003829F934
MDIGRSELGGKPSLVESFEIHGLYGYRSIGMSSSYAATILIAKNGSGKTTLLSAMDAFLRRQFVRLNDLVFDKIVCKLSTFAEPLELTRADLNDFVNASVRAELIAGARKLGVEEVELFNFLEGEYSSGSFAAVYDSSSKLFSSIVRASNYSSRDAVEFCQKIRESYYCSTPNLSKLWTVLTETFKNVDIIYLPTYRRIELPIYDDDVEGQSPRRPKPNIRIPERGLFSGNIQFGLGDISERLRELNQSMLMESNASYREISANIINDLLDGSFERHSTNTEHLPERDELQLFFSRLKDVRNRIGPYGDVSIPDIDKVYNRQADTESNKFLFYFLGKLNATIQSTRKIEGIVEAFIDSCNKYLSSQDPSTETSSEAFIDRRVDGKVLCLNRRNLTVHVESLPLRRKIKLNALSSGEKQMISLFAKMFLYEKNKLVLIDEPELSLSIGWQREILKDILKAPNCVQIVAITHSPFIFDNELEPFAKSLKSSINEAALAQQQALDGNENFMEEENNDSLF